MVINGQSLLNLAPIENMLDHKATLHGVSHGLDESGYDIRVKQRVIMFPFRSFVIASSIERFNMPDNIVALPKNKSTWARKGLDASMTTKIEPGWRGNLTIELVYHGWKPLIIPAGCGILSILFYPLAHTRPYEGKYQDQPDMPVHSKAS